jgi:hypothetical protein
MKIMSEIALDRGWLLSSIKSSIDRVQRSGVVRPEKIETITKPGFIQKVEESLNYTELKKAS